MKRTLLRISAAIVFVVAQASAVLAANPDTGPGCGLGKLAWNDYKHQKSIAPQVMMATTNGTFGSQTFGISTGTSGCTNDGTVMAEHKTTLFAELNFETLSEDMARGGGEHLASLAALMGVPDDKQAEFFALSQERYQALIQAGEPTPRALLGALHEVLAGHPMLAQAEPSR